MAETKTPSAEGNKTVACTPNTVPAIPRDWAQLGAKSGYDPKKVEDLRLWIVGPSGEGKTNFLSSIPDHLILDFDDGACGVAGGRATRIVVRDYDHYMAITNKLIEEGKAGKRKFHRVSIDTVDEWAGMIANQLQEEKQCESIEDFGSKGKGFALIKNRCWSRLRALEEAGYVWSCVGHQKITTDTLPGGAERTRLRDAIFPMFSKQITTRAEFKLTIYCKPVTVTPKIKRKIAGGREIKIDGPSETTQKYFLSSLTTATEGNKERGAPGMDRKFEIPRVDAWEVFKQKYNEAVEAAKKQYS